MRRLSIYSILAILALTGCQTKELNISPKRESKPFTATIEDGFNGAETKTYLDEHGNVLWKRGDQISIFVGSTINEQYQVTDDSEGKTAASLNRVTTPGFVAGGEIDNNVAFYPYTSTATIARNESAYVISGITLPAVQNYAEASFGNGAFPMAAVTSNTEDMRLKFKNVLGGLKLQLKGTARIKSIKVTGNQDEILCGAAAVTVSTSSTPSINLTDATAKVVTLDCGEGVQLDAETATPFVIALPPMTMEGGFTVLVTDAEGEQMEIKTTKQQTINRSYLLKMPEVTYEGISAGPKPLTFTSTGETSISLIKEGSPDAISLEFKVGSAEWTDYTIGEVIALANGEEVSFRAGAAGNSSFSQEVDQFYRFSIGGEGTVAASGSVMFLLDQNESSIIPSSFCFYGLFYNCRRLTTAPDLPATTLTDGCYSNMFRECSRLTAAPDLPATTLAVGCYSQMFAGCSRLSTAPDLPATTLANSCYSRMFSGCPFTTAPELPVTTLADQCYSGMFSGCSSLTTPPDLPATTLADYCYYDMFSYCSSLTTAPDLPATTLAVGCYTWMFRDCSSLTTAPELPATTLAVGCYNGMFSYCSSLTTAPTLPATTLAVGCYSNMFSYCSSLTTAPDLPATTLAESCYNRMFEDCSSLTTAPALPATTLEKSCYNYMFSGCSSLMTAPDLPATTLEESCYNYMFKNCIRLNHIKCLATDIYARNSIYYWLLGVASTGTFIKAPEMEDWPSGPSGIPEGWTVVDAE